MFVDTRQLDDGSSIDCDICVVGAGAAGITIARELAGRDRLVCLLESGGLEHDSDTQALNEGQSVGLDCFPPASSRLRFFGGTTNHWEGFCSTLQASDFEKRTGVPYSGWPISLSDLGPFYTRAQPICQLDSIPLEAPDKWPVGQNVVLSRDGAGKLTPKLFQMSPPTRFGLVYRDDIQKAQSVRCLLHANLLELVPNTTVNEVMVARAGTLTGKRFAVRAKTFVLACGAIENARVLLNSRALTPQGLGNGSDLVGRFFMEHPAYTQAMRLVPTSTAEELPLLEPRGVRNYVAIALSPDWVRKQGCLAMAFLGRPETSVAEATLWSLSRSVRELRFPDDLPHHLNNLMEHRAMAARALLKRLPGGNKATEFMARSQPMILDVLAEQSPNPNSRVILVEERDALGQQRISLDWQVRSQDHDLVLAGITDFGAELRRLGFGALQILFDPKNSSSIRYEAQWHQMGTTRMSADPKTGVVDSNCRVHGLRNLYIAGGSVFPTSGFVNPTLTIVALSLRLADHLKEQRN